MDFDGVFTKLEGSWDELFKVLVIPYIIQTLRFLLKPVPNQEIVDIVKEIKNNRKIVLIILTSRPYFLRNRLKRWLIKNDIDCLAFCVGRFINPTNRKEEFLEELRERFEFDLVYIDNNEKVRKRFGSIGFEVKSPSEFCQTFEI